MMAGGEAGRGGGGEEGVPARGWLGRKSEVLMLPLALVAMDRLFSETTRSDFSKTFQSLIVLSVNPFQKGLYTHCSTGLTIGGEEKMGLVPPLAPPDPINLFLDFQTLEVIEFGFVTLKLCIEFIFATLFGIVSGALK